jgi:hypothetical protein
MKAILVGLVAVCFLASGCRTTYIGHSWKQAKTEAGDYTNVLVVSLAKLPDGAVESEMEKHLVNDLNVLGYNAYSATKKYGMQFHDQLIDLLTMDSTIRFDAILIVTLFNKDKERYYAPAKIIYTPYAILHTHFKDYYSLMLQRINAEGYYQNNTPYFWEANLYDLKKEQLVMSLQTTILDRGSTMTSIHNYSIEIIHQMKSENVLPHKKAQLKTM